MDRFRYLTWKVRLGNQHRVERVVTKDLIKMRTGPNPGLQALNTWAVLILHLSFSTTSLLGLTIDLVVANGRERVWD